MPNELKTTCPKSVRVGVQTFQIVETDPKDDTLLTEGNSGYCQDARNIIVIDKNLHESKKKVTLFHEIMHATRFTFENTRPNYKTDYEEWEHHFISVWENSMLMVLKDNPKLTKWLLDNSD